MYIISFQIIFFCFILAVNAKTNDFQECVHHANSSSSFILPSDEEYARLNYQANVRDFIHPLGFIVVNSSYDVKVAIDCARERNLSISSKSGGHSYEKFAFKDNQTWVIDFKNLKYVKVNRKTMTADVGPGINLHELSKCLWEAGKLEAVVGSCFSVGISGFALGGGLGTTVRKYGLMVDNLKEFEMVTSNGKILKVNKNKHKELFWALRGGGGGNFGVVTRFSIKIKDASKPVVTIIRDYNAENFVEVFHKWQTWASSNPDSSITSLFRYRISYLRLIIVITERRCSKRNRLLNKLKSYFPNITDQDVFVTDRMKSLELVSTNEWSLNYEIFHKVKSFYVSKKLILNETRKFASLLKQYPCMVLFEMSGGKISQTHPSETAYFHRRTYYLVQYAFLIEIENDKEYENALNEGKKGIENLRKLQKHLSFMDNGHSYVNYPDLELKDWEYRYYGANYKRLREIKRKFDPSNIFKFAQSIRL